MTRGVDTTLAKHLAAKQTSVIDMVFLDLMPSPVYLHNDIGSISHDGNSWIGVGAIGGISDMTEDEELESQDTELVLRLDRNSPSLPDIAKVAATPNLYRNRRCIIYKAARDLVTGKLIGTPQLIVSGFMERFEIVHGVDLAEATLRIVDARVEGDRTPNLVWSNADRQTERDGYVRASGRIGLKFMADVVDFNATWGPGGPAAKRTEGRGRPPGRRFPPGFGRLG